MLQKLSFNRKFMKLAIFFHNSLYEMTANESLPSYCLNTRNG